MSDRYVPTPIGFARVNKEPLDKYEIFSSLEELINYVNNGPAYAGQVCKVIANDDLILEYLVENNGNSYKLKPLYPTPFEEYISTYNEITGGAPTTNTSYLTNPAIGNKWLMIYYYDNTKDKDIFSDIEPFSINYNLLSLLYNLELYRDNNGNFNFLYCSNDIIYKWSQPTNFVTEGLKFPDNTNSFKNDENKHTLQMNHLKTNNNICNLIEYDATGKFIGYVGGIFPYSKPYSPKVCTALFIAIP